MTDGWSYAVLGSFITMIVMIVVGLSMPPIPADPIIDESCYKYKSEKLVIVGSGVSYSNCGDEIDKMLGYGYEIKAYQFSDHISTELVMVKP